MITIVTWLWGTKYSKTDVERLRIGVARHLVQPHRFVCMSDRIIDSYVHLIREEDRFLLREPGCFARLRLFDPGFQEEFKASDRVINLDLDVVITGPLDSLFDRDEPFVILSGANADNPCPFNGSVFMLRKGAHPEIFEKFSLEAAKNVPYYTFPDDQAWFHHMLPDAATWPVAKSGIYAFKKPGWPKGDDLPSNASIVAFPGWRSPGRFKELPWVRDNWTSLSSFKKN